MKLMIEIDPKIEKYIGSSPVIDWHHLTIKQLAKELSDGCPSQTEIARRCFEWVQDQIKHSYDFKLNPVTCKASDVLLHKTGYCYAKSHLLAALLRANNIPSGFCYQRLRSDNRISPFCLHGLNAIYLQEFGWYRIDARGNKPGTDAQFCPPSEKLAFHVDEKVEVIFPKIWSDPLEIVIDTLTKNRTYLDVYNNLPDMVS
jgi:transglutaminase-like putative cysteine protease